MKYKLTSEVLADIYKQAASAYPKEGCGFLIGRWEGLEPVIDEAIEATNQKAEERNDYFEIDPRQYHEVEKSLRGTGRQILGFHHSHPNHPDVPSFTDLKFAQGWPGFLWLIAQVIDGVPVSQQTYVLSEDGERFVRLECDLQRIAPPEEKRADYERMEAELAEPREVRPADDATPIIRRKVYLTFSKTLMQKPIVWQLGHDFHIITDVRQASISGDNALVGLGLEGTAAELERGLAWLREEGVGVEPIELGIVE